MRSIFPLLTLILATASNYLFKTMRVLQSHVSPLTSNTQANTSGKRSRQPNCSVKPGNSSHPLPTTLLEQTAQDGQQAKKRRWHESSVTDNQLRSIDTTIESTTTLHNHLPFQSSAREWKIRYQGGGMDRWAQHWEQAVLARGEGSRRDHWMDWLGVIIEGWSVVLFQSLKYALTCWIGRILRPVNDLSTWLHWNSSVDGTRNSEWSNVWECSMQVRRSLALVLFFLQCSCRSRTE